MSRVRALARGMAGRLARFRLIRLGGRLKPSALVVFAGNPRSGTTLLRSLLDAHPAIVIGQEFNLLERFQQGERSWRYLAGALYENAVRFDAAPHWEGYDYRVQAPAGRDPAAVRVIGDKKAGRTLRLFAGDATLLPRFLEWSPVPVRFIHCVRHPMDVIATKTLRNPLELEENVALYFGIEARAQELGSRLGGGAFRRIHLEDLIASPRESLAALCRFLEVEVLPEHLEACAGRVFRSPRRSRGAVRWPQHLREEVERRIGGIGHLRRYAGQADID